MLLMTFVKVEVTQSAFFVQASIPGQFVWYCQLRECIQTALSIKCTG